MSTNVRLYGGEYILTSRSVSSAEDIVYNPLSMTIRERSAQASKIRWNSSYPYLILSPERCFAALNSTESIPGVSYDITTSTFSDGVHARRTYMSTDVNRPYITFYPNQNCAWAACCQFDGGDPFSIEIAKTMPDQDSANNPGWMMIAFNAILPTADNFVPDANGVALYPTYLNSSTGSFYILCDLASNSADVYSIVEYLPGEFITRSLGTVPWSPFSYTSEFRRIEVLPIHWGQGLGGSQYLKGISLCFDGVTFEVPVSNSLYNISTVMVAASHGGATVGIYKYIFTESAVIATKWTPRSYASAPFLYAKGIWGGKGFSAATLQTTGTVTFRNDYGDLVTETLGIQSRVVDAVTQQRLVAKLNRGASPYNTPVLYSLRLESAPVRTWNSGRPLCDITNYVTEISRSSSLGEPTTMNMTVLEPRDENGNWPMQSNILNSIGAPVYVEYQSVPFFTGYIDEINEELLISRGSHQTIQYNIRCTDKTKLMENEYFIDNYSFSGEYLSSVVSQILQRAGLTLDIWTYPWNPFLDKNFIKTGFLEIDKGTSVRGALERVRELMGTDMHYAFLWNGAFQIVNVCNTYSDFAALGVAPAATFYKTYERGLEMDSKHWVRNLNYKLSDQDFYNEIMLVGGRPVPEGQQDGPYKTRPMVARAANYASIVNPASPSYYGRYKTFAMLRRPDSAGILRYIATQLYRRYCLQKRGHYSFDVLYDSHTIPGAIISLDTTSEYYEYLLVNRVEAVINRRQAVDDGLEDFECTMSVEATELVRD